MNKGRTPAGGVRREDIPRAVYFVAADNGLVKIGCGEVDRRLELLRICSPVPLTLLGSIPLPYSEIYQVEKKLHWLFAEKRQHGEWFSLTDEDLLTVRGLYPGGKWMLP
mgnify:CR=1 FL=1